MIFIAGATGFTGEHLVDHLLSKGNNVKCLTRSASAGNTLHRKGASIIHGDITDAGSLINVLRRDDIVIHLVGIMEEKGNATFQSVHVEGTRNLVSEALRAGVRHFFYQSALGADAGSWSEYLRTKAEAEEIVKQSGLPYTIFRPSLIIGPWDGFTKKIVEMLKYSPVIPIPGEGKARFQPIYVVDWLKCIMKVLEEPANYRGVYDIGGPEYISYSQIVEKISKALGYRKPGFNIPMGFMRLTTSIMERFLPAPPVTQQQLRLLEQDNICDTDAVVKYFGFRPETFEKALSLFISKS